MLPDQDAVVAFGGVGNDLVACPGEREVADVDCIVAGFGEERREQR